MLFARGKKHPLPHRNLGLGRGCHLVGGLTVYPDGSHRDIEIVERQPFDDIVETLSLAGILGKANNRNAPSFEYLSYERHYCFLRFLLRSLRCSTAGSIAMSWPSSRPATPSSLFWHSGQWHSW